MSLLSLYEKPYIIIEIVKDNNGVHLVLWHPKHIHPGRNTERGRAGVQVCCPGGEPFRLKKADIHSLFEISKQIKIENR